MDKVVVDALAASERILFALDHPDAPDAPDATSSATPAL
jgi:UDP-galactopyranose mutase